MLKMVPRTVLEVTLMAYCYTYGVIVTQMWFIVTLPTGQFFS